jgi:micrococcal nuclease
MAADGTVLVMENDRDKYGRIVGEVFTEVPNSEEEKFLNAEQVRSGLAYQYKKY